MFCRSSLQITAEQIVREAKGLQEEEYRAPRQKARSVLQRMAGARLCRPSRNQHPSVGQTASLPSRHALSCLRESLAGAQPLTPLRTQLRLSSVAQISDPEELAEYQLKKRKEFEDLIRRVRWNGAVWVKARTA